MAPSAVIETSFVVICESDTKHRQCHLAIDKWANLIVDKHQLARGLIFESWVP